MEITIKQMKALKTKVENLIYEFPENETRIHIALLQTIGIVKDPKNRKEKNDNFQLVKILIMADWPLCNLIEALKNYHVEKKHIIEILLAVFENIVLTPKHDFTITNKKLSGKKRIENLKKIAKAMGQADWNDDEIVAILQKFEKGSIIVIALEKIHWTPKRIINAFEQTRISKILLLIILKKAGWPNQTIIKAVCDAGWSDYNVVYGMSSLDKITFCQIMRDLLAINEWSARQIADVFCSFINGNEILTILIQAEVNKRDLICAIKFLLRSGRIKENQIRQILKENEFTAGQIDQIFRQAAENLLSFDKIESLLNN